MVWVRSEYAGELAVLSAWLCAFVPWNVTYSPDVGGGLLFVRFPFFQIRYAFGDTLARTFVVSDPLSAVAFQRGQSIQLAYQAWVVGAAVLLAAVLLSVAYYAHEKTVEAGPVDPVRAMGTLLLSAGVVLTAATALLVTRGLPGVPIPVGLAFLYAFGGVLLTIDRA